MVSVGLVTMSASRIYYSAPCCQLSYLPENISLDSPITHYNSGTKQCVEVLTQHTTLVNNVTEGGIDDAIIKPLDEVTTPKNSASDLLIKEENVGSQKLVINSPTSAIIISSGDSNKSLHFKDFIVKPKVCNNNLDEVDGLVKMVYSPDQGSTIDESTTDAVVNNTYLVNNRSTMYRMQIPLAQRILATPPKIDLDVEPAVSTDNSDKDDGNDICNEKRKLSVSLDKKPIGLVKKLTTEAKLSTSATAGINCSVGVNKAVKSSGFRKKPSLINFNKIHKQMRMFMP